MRFLIIVLILALGGIFISLAIFSPRILEKQVIEDPEIIEIPELKVSAYIEDVGLDNNGNMDVPQNVQNTAWYSLGYEIGEDGNAVIAGHFNTPNGDPSVFYNLEDLIPGDEIYVSGGGERMRFEVISVESYPTDNFPVEQVFGADTAPMLNLVTCDGDFNVALNSFDERVVVVARAD